MEFSKEEMMEIMTVFKAESAENLVIFNDKMKEIEKNPSNPAAIELLHRTSHSIKGAARMLGLTPIENIGRALEDGFKAAKEGKPVLTPATITIVNEAIAFISQLIDKLEKDGTTDGIDISSIQTKLEQFK
jgi:chemotaxis protein histidine kinase CheA